MDDIIKILEKNEHNRHSNSTDFIDPYEEDIEWIKENPEEVIAPSPITYESNSPRHSDPTNFFYIPKEGEISSPTTYEPFDFDFTYIEVPKQEEKVATEVDVKKKIASIRAKRGTNIYDDDPEILKIKRRGKRENFILSYLPEGLYNALYGTFEDKLIGVLVGLFVAGSLTLNIMETSIMKSEIAARNNPSPKKQEQVVERTTSVSKTTFTKNENGTVTNILNSDIYKEFEEYARSNDLIMNIENFEDFCDNYYSDSTIRRGGR